MHKVRIVGGIHFEDMIDWYEANKVTYNVKVVDNNLRDDIQQNGGKVFIASRPIVVDHQFEHLHHALLFKLTFGGK